MEEARAVLARLERIETLEREGARVPLLLAELRELIREATEWAEEERDPRAREAAAALAAAGHEDDSFALTRPSRNAATVRDPWWPRSSDTAPYSPGR